MNALILTLLGIVSVALAYRDPFPTQDSVIYKYTANVKAGTIQPAEFASEFGLECNLHVTRYERDPTLRNAYSIALTDVNHGLYNGPTMPHEPLDIMQPIKEESNAILTPFLIVYDENGHLQGVKLMENEPVWSRNIKKSIASLLQLDYANIYQQQTIKSHSFVTREDTIHGTCEVAYNVEEVKNVEPSTYKSFQVTKIHEPENCTHFSHQEFNHVVPGKCHVEEEDPMTTSSRRVFHVEDWGTYMLIKKLIGVGAINYVPWVAKVDAHYLLTNQTLMFQTRAPKHESTLPTADFETVSITRNLTFEEPQTQCFSLADIDVTEGRHLVKMNDLVFKLNKMLDEAAIYLEENHIEKKHPDWKHGQTINRLLNVMSMMNVETLEEVYGNIQNAMDAKEITMKNIFLGLVPNVGTMATCLFTRNLIRRQAVPDLTAVTMLGELPKHVKYPSKELLLEMRELLYLGDPISSTVREASIFCFSTLIHKVYRNRNADHADALLQGYLLYFINNVKNVPAYHTKMVYMMAMKNVRLHDILEHLEPIIRGDLTVSEKPHSIRLQAIWAIKDVVTDPRYAHDLLWPILSNVSLPVAIRIAAYDVLMQQLPHTGLLMNIHWLMVDEKDEHLFNYHMETIKALANSKDLCMAPISRMARKVLAFTSARRVTDSLSRKIRIDYFDKNFEYSESLEGSLIVEKLTGLPYVGSFVHTTIFGRKPVTEWGIHWNVDGLTEVLKNLQYDVLGKTVETVTDNDVKNLLAQAARDMPAIKDVHIDLIVTMNNQVVSMFHASKSDWLQLINDLKQWKKMISRHMDNVNWQTVMYNNHFEMHVPTDIGFPAVLTTKMPSLKSLRMSTIVTGTNDLTSLKLKMKYQDWMHGEYAMSVYNPISDVWHSVRRTTSEDIVLPLDLTIAYNHDAKSLKVTLPRLPVSEHSVGGMSTYNKNYVTITSDETDLLKYTCSTCRHHELVTSGVNPKTYENIVDSKDTGLRYTMAVYDCENDFSPVSPFANLLLLSAEERSNFMDSEMLDVAVSVRQMMMNNRISGQRASCTSLFKVEPSDVHPASMVELTGKISVQDMDYVHERLDFSSSMRMDVHGTLNVVAASTNKSVRQWDMILNVVQSQGHVNNSMRMTIIRTTPEEKNLRICIEGQKDYQAVISDLLHVDPGKMETNSKMTIMMGHTNEDKCVRDEMDVTVTVKGERLEDQRGQIVDGSVQDTCLKQSQNPLFHTEVTSIPATQECIENAVMQSTLRKYTVNMALRKVPHNVASNVNLVLDVLRTFYYTYTRHSANHVEPGNLKILFEYPYMSAALNMSVVTPMYTYELVDLPYGHQYWNLLMDNTHYELSRLHKYANGDAKVCSIYPQVILTFDNGTIPYTIPDKWTLISGDYMRLTYSVFVKALPNNRLAVKVHVGKDKLEIVPGETKTMVIMNDKVIENYAQGVTSVPTNIQDIYSIKLTKAYGHLAIDSQLVPMYMFCTPNSVNIIVETSMQGLITGMCGHMDNTHKFLPPQQYTL